jgi:nitronate monooxygenase
MTGVLTGLLGLSVPLVQAGMGGVAGPALAAAVARAGAGGVVALYRLDPVTVADVVDRTRAATGRPFGVNVIPEVAGPDLLMAQLEAALAGLPAGGFVTVYGLPPNAAAHWVTNRGYPLLVQVGDVAAARRAVELGADAVVLQGGEAGGHLLGTHHIGDLLDSVHAAQLGVPLLIAGGVGRGRQYAALRDRGAAGAMCGTMFVATTESAAHPRYKAAVVAATAAQTLVTDVFDFGWPGRVHRVLGNRVTQQGTTLPRAFIARARVGERQHPIARFSANVPTRDITGAVEEMAMYCGVSCTEVTRIAPAAAVVADFARELATDPIPTSGGPR